MAASPEPVLHSIEDTVSRAAKAKFSLPEVRVKQENVNQFWKKVECGPVTYGPMKVTDRKETRVYEEAIVNDTKAQQSCTVKRTLTKTETRTLSFTGGLKLNEKISLSTNIPFFGGSSDISAEQKIDVTRTTTSTITTSEEVTFSTVVPPESKVTSCLKVTEVSRSADFTADVSAPATHPFMVYPRSKLNQFIATDGFWFRMLHVIIGFFTYMFMPQYIPYWFAFAVGAGISLIHNVLFLSIELSVEAWTAKSLTAKDAFMHLPGYRENSARGIVTCQLEGNFRAQGLDTNLLFKQEQL